MQQNLFVRSTQSMCAFVCEQLSLRCGHASVLTCVNIVREQFHTNSKNYLFSIMHII